MANGVPQEDIGVISPYRHQLKKLNSLLQQVYAKVEVSTVDKYQGRDKKCIIMSLTRSNPGQQTGDLLKDWQRLNVAITRAKEKVVFVGSRGTLAGSASFSNLIKILEQNHWVSYELLYFFLFSDKQIFLSWLCVGGFFGKGCSSLPPFSNRNETTNRHVVAAHSASSSYFFPSCEIWKTAAWRCPWRLKDLK